MFGSRWGWSKFEMKLVLQASSADLNIFREHRQFGIPTCSKHSMSIIGLACINKTTAQPACEPRGGARPTRMQAPGVAASVVTSVTGTVTACVLSPSRIRTLQEPDRVIRVILVTWRAAGGRPQPISFCVGLVALRLPDPADCPSSPSHRGPAAVLQVQVTRT